MSPVLKKRSVNVFSPRLGKRYPFIKINDKNGNKSNVLCEKCGSEFNIAYSGKSCIDNHISSKRHKRNLLNASSSMKNFVSTTDYSLAAREGVWAYHTIKCNQSFQSCECSSKVIRTCFEIENYHCAKTKCEAIVVGVIAPHSTEILATELVNAHYITVSTDASNHGDIKMVPVSVRFFNPLVGVRVKILEFTSVKGETSDIISKLIMTTAEKNLINKKVVGFCGDNCATNFGSYERGGENNVFYKLKEWLPDLLGVGCAAHITHNGLKYACYFLPIDIECIVVKIYKHFHIYTVRVSILKEICDQAKDVEYSKLLGYSNTRFLALSPAIRSILNLFDALKQYFLNLEKCPPLIKTFFMSPLSKLWLLFVKEQADRFQETVLKIEGDKISAFEVSFHLDVLKSDLTIRKLEKYLDPNTEKEKNTLIANGSCSEAEVDVVFQQFFDDAVDYILRWYRQFEIFNRFSWADLRRIPDWESVKKSLTIMEENTSFNIATHSSAVFQQLGYIKKYVSDDKVAQWKKDKVSTEARWVEVFSHLNRNDIPFEQFAHLIEYVLCFPGTSGPVERLFAEVNKIWKQESTSLKLSTLKAMLMVKNNMEYSCLEFFEFLKTQPGLLRKIAGQEKYDFKRPKVVDESTMPIDLSEDDE